MLYCASPALGSDEVNDPFAVAWGDHERRDSWSVLQRILVYACSYQGLSLIIFVNVAGTEARTVSSWI